MTEPTDAPRGSLGLKLFLAFLVLSTAALAAITLMLSNQNRAMRAQIEALQERVRAGGLVPGDLVEPLTLQDRRAEPFLLDFGPDRPPTLLLLTSMGCDACEHVVPLWESVLAEVRPQRLRTLGVRAGARPDDLARQDSSLWTCYGAEPGRERWLRRIPLTPSAVLLDPGGRVLHRWYGHPSEAQLIEMRIVLADVAGASPLQ